MKVLIAHVGYRHRGGEEAVVAHEADLLRGAGVDVSTLVIPSEGLGALPAAEKASLALHLGDHAYGRRLMREAIDAHTPDVVHAHNLYPLLGMGALGEAREADIGTVHTWHNYRASCIAGTHLYRGERCTACTVDRRLTGCVRGCYRGSRPQSVSYAGAMRTQAAAVRAGLPDRVICLTTFQRDWFVGQGLPEHRFALKPNSVATGPGAPWSERSGALFAGRLSAEKGVESLVAAWPRGGETTLNVVGGGPRAEAVRTLAAGHDRVHVHGEISPEAVREALRHARVLLVPSLWFEVLPIVVLEALSEGTPVLAFDGGSIAGIASVEAVPYGDFGSLERRAQAVCDLDDAAWGTLSRAARSAHESHFTDERNVAALLGLYESITGGA